MIRRIRPQGAPLRACWHESHRGGVSVALVNYAAIAAKLEAWHKVVGLVQRLPRDERDANIAAGAFGLPLGVVCADVPELTAWFEVVSWQPESILLTLRFTGTSRARPRWEYHYLHSEYLE